MSETVIRVENLSKRYRIGLKEEMHDTLAGAMVDFVKRPVHNLRRLRRLSTFSEDGHDPEDTIWALKDISFEVKRGEVVGIIGRNGAGKTTLLKVLSRITHPTSGRVEIRGRVSSLLAVGTGFHRELTGRENIYLNGAILGMKKTEIERKFDEIVDFSGVEKFIDTPVKRYSSGMYVRLAFAVAAHLEPEILLVDEVLAVGDAAFQKKCLGKMGEVAKEGRTVLFVSHNMSAVNELCSRVTFLDEGSIVAQGEPQAMIDRYLTSTFDLMRVPIKERRDRTGSGRIRFAGVRILADGEEVSSIEWGQDVTFEVSYEAPEPICPRDVRFAISVSTMNGIKFISFDSSTTQFTLESMGTQGVLRCHVPKFPLIRGRYRGLLYGKINGMTADRLPDAFEFEVVSGKYPNVGWLAVKHQWAQDTNIDQP